MMASARRNRAEEDAITISGVLKSGGAIVSIIVAVISSVWFAATFNTRMTVKDTADAAFRREFSDYCAQNDKAVAKLTERADTTERNMKDMSTKLDKAVAILERIDAKVNSP